MTLYEFNQKISELAGPYFVTTTFTPEDKVSLQIQVDDQHKYKRVAIAEIIDGRPAIDFPQRAVGLGNIDEYLALLKLLRQFLVEFKEEQY